MYVLQNEDGKFYWKSDRVSSMHGLNEDFKEAHLFKSKKGAEIVRKTPCYSKCEIREVARYKQAIEKIKEICTKYKEICANCEGDEYIDCVDCTEGGEAQVAIKVLQICDEVNDVQDNL